MIPILPEAADLGTAVDIHAGFPNAAADSTEGALSLDRLLITSPHSTYFFRIRGHRWRSFGIFDSDIAIVDRAATLVNGSIIVDWDDAGALCLRRWPNSSPTSWGVLTAVVHPLRPSIIH
mgnify:CR=1 FL=1